MQEDEGQYAAKRVSNKKLGYTKVQRLMGEYLFYNKPATKSLQLTISMLVDDIVWTTFIKVEIKDKELLC